MGITVERDDSLVGTCLESAVAQLEEPEHLLGLQPAPTEYVAPTSVVNPPVITFPTITIPTVPSFTIPPFTVPDFTIPGITVSSASRSCRACCVSCGRDCVGCVRRRNKRLC